MFVVHVGLHNTIGSTQDKRLIAELGESLLDLSGHELGSLGRELLLKGVLVTWQRRMRQAKPTYSNADFLCVEDLALGLALLLEDTNDLLVLPAHLVSEAVESAILERTNEVEVEGGKKSNRFLTLEDAAQA